MKHGYFSMARFAALAFIGLGGCQPDYPKCRGDKDCKTGEFCVKGQCQQCRDDRDCTSGAVCKGGRCEAAPGACQTAADCPEGQGCKDGRCEPCDADAQCGEGGRCRTGRCLGPGECGSDEDCASGEECQNGRCIAPPSPVGKGEAPCALEVVYFDFNEALLTDGATATLVANAECLKGKGAGRTVRLEGRCDARGTEEYNMALGDRRARSVEEHLRRLGVEGAQLRPVSRGKLDSTGMDDAGWAKDRRVDFIWE